MVSNFSMVYINIWKFYYYGCWIGDVEKHFEFLFFFFGDVLSHLVNLIYGVEMNVSE